MMPVSAANEVTTSLRWCQASATTARLPIFLPRARIQWNMRSLTTMTGTRTRRVSGLGRGAGLAERERRVPEDQRTHADQRKRGDGGGERFRPTVAGGVLRIGRLGGDAQAVKRDARAHDVGERFAGIRNERVGMAEDARRQLGRAQALR